MGASYFYFFDKYERKEISRRKETFSEGKLVFIKKNEKPK